MKSSKFPRTWEYIAAHVAALWVEGAFGSTPAAQREVAGSNPALPSSGSGHTATSTENRQAAARKKQLPTLARGTDWNAGRAVIALGGL